MNSWPTLQEYNQALAPQYFQQNLHIPESGPTSIQTNAFGIPNALSGGFAYIYQLTLQDGSRRALRLFHSIPDTRIAGLRTSYGLVQSLRNLTIPLRDNFVDSRWIDSCLSCASRTVPGILMDWVQAPILASWLEKHFGDPKKLRRVRRNLADLQQRLEQAQILHGDLQANNIAVTSTEGILLLDYDNVCQIDKYTSAYETGHIHFQHPDPARHARAVDRFPFLVIDLGLALLETAPELFSQYGQGENILFTADDFAQPRSSPLLQRAATIPGMERACELFMAICEGPASAVPALNEFHIAAGLSLEGIPAQPVAAAAVPGAARGAARSSAGTAEPITAGTVTAERPTRQAYRPAYPLYEPDLFLNHPDLAAGLVGQKIELVGLITEIKEDYTKYGSPYVFVNFNDWRRGGIKLIFWSEGLDAFEERAPDKRWEGRWISVTGMVDEPYSNSRYGTLSYSITITDPSQVRLISAAEARRRLNTAAPYSVSANSPNTSWLREQLVHESPPVYKNAAQIQQKPTNMELLEQLKQENEQINTYYTPKQKQPAENSGCLFWVIGFIIFFIWIYLSQ
ncbi:MAG TPA: hypothetical protein PK897_07170 [Treponema sp.]|nr:hypothetical protein [Treponema sp.]